MADGIDLANRELPRDRCRELTRRHRRRRGDGGHTARRVRFFIHDLVGFFGEDVKRLALKHHKNAAYLDGKYSEETETKEL